MNHPYFYLNKNDQRSLTIRSITDSVSKSKGFSEKSRIFLTFLAFQTICFWFSYLLVGKLRHKKEACGVSWIYVKPPHAVKFSPGKTFRQWSALPSFAIMARLMAQRMARREARLMLWLLPTPKASLPSGVFKWM